jgi:Na+/H+-dicarboxylate symporter
MDKSPETGRPLVELVSQLRLLVRTRLWAQIIAGMVLGIGLGLLLSPSGVGLVSENAANQIGSWVALPGQLFLALIQMVVVPLVISSIVLGIASSGDLSFLKRIALRIAPYFVATTTISVLLGIVVATLLKPGEYIDRELVQSVLSTEHSGTIEQTDSTPMEPEQSIPEQLVSLIPTNPLSAALDRSMLQIVVFALLMAAALVSISAERSQLVTDLLVAIQELAMKVVSWAMMMAPYAVFGLLAQITIKIGPDAILSMSAYVGTVLLGLLLLLVFYLAIVAFVAGRNPLTFLAAVREVQLLAFSTSSSAAVMPLSMQTAEEKLGVKPSVSQFIVPLGATVNMDGTALYQVVAAVFLTQVFGIDLSLEALILLTVTTVGASIGSPSTPGVGIVILATIVQGIGVPASGVALILGVDRILDMSRTAVNVTGDLTACVVMDKWMSGVDPASNVDQAAENP